jgi:hypothetical protein
MADMNGIFFLIAVSSRSDLLQKIFFGFFVNFWHHSRQFIANKHNPQEEYLHLFLHKAHNISVFISKK